ncbi:LuxR family transcriptional regulator [Aureimonas ureilytica]|uniref:LuxR family transcriptional regulator n=1 Tax=Aureimonas ureilytica TaxID=401562 RepID=A0A175RSC7_9HYPH|nr:response regulator transcription factor [Aureimonas ureilytica]KTR06606.1 LuxR family transcriptional regulator [Aureimonas ureilytica]
MTSKATSTLERERDIVLVVDDSPDTLRMLTDAIELGGATVLVALDGAQALGIAEAITPDIVLMDAVMPGMDGFETTRRLKADAALRHVPVIFMTGLAETEHVVRGLEAGGVDYVTKPIVPDELLARMRVHLANARAAQNARAALDTAGRFLLAVDGNGLILWSTPQATRLLAGVLADKDGRPALPTALCDWLRAGSQPPPPPGGELMSEDGVRLQLSPLGKVGENEHLFRLTVDDTAGEEALLRRHFNLTAREADVLLWLTRGKSNRDIATILDLSPRTVNKHLEVVFTKLGVENRATASFLVMKTLSER